MSIPPAVVTSARMGWRWQWNQLMNGLAPADEHGNYQRPKSQFQEATIPETIRQGKRSSNHLPFLLIGRSCPWAHRTWLVHQLRNLNTTLKVKIVFADHAAGRWKIDPPLLGCNSLLDVYKLCGSPPRHRATVPVLIDPGNPPKELPSILGNESAQLVEVLNQWPSTVEVPDLEPAELKEEISNWGKKLQPTINNGVYKCGFARNQTAYNKASQDLFEALEHLDKSLSQKGPWLCGEKITLADVRLFPTLVRWEMVYLPLFGCSKEPLWTFRNIWEWRKRFMAIPSVASTCDAEAWRNDYFGALFPLRPSNIIPSGPDLNKIINAAPSDLG